LSEQERPENLDDILLGDLRPPKVGEIIYEEVVDETQSSPEPEGWTPTADPVILDGIRSTAPTDLGASEQLVKRHGNDMRYVAELGWHAWDRTRWSNHRGIHLVNRMTGELCRYMGMTLAAAPDSTEYRPWRSYWHIAGNRIDRIVHRAADHRDILVDPNDFDKDPMLFNCLNCTIDIGRGTSRPHSRLDLITRIAPITYNPKATAPTWLRFLSEIFAPHPDIIDWLQKAIGYSMTGVIREHVLFICYGPSAQNGKTTLLEAIRNIVGDYGATTNASNFMQGKAGRFDSADIVGARYVEASEIDKTDQLSISLIKRITGGDKVRVEKKFQNSFEYQPQCKVFIRTNRLPQIKDGGDKGIWVRMKVIPFDVHFPENKRDTKLPEKLKLEYEGIFTWMVEGAFRYIAEGLGESPYVIRQAGAAYNDDSNPFGRFLREECELAPDAKAEKKSFYIRYVKWSEANGLPIVEKKEVENQLHANGVAWGKKHHSGTIYYYEGVRTIF
jgi:putative DNA primase/helicase